MTKIDIFSGFLGAGKTTLIKKLLKEALAGSQVVLIENEFGEIGIDGGFLKESGIEIKEIDVYKRQRLPPMTRRFAGSWSLMCAPQNGGRRSWISCGKKASPPSAG